MVTFLLTDAQDDYAGVVARAVARHAGEVADQRAGATVATFADAAGAVAAALDAQRELTANGAGVRVALHTGDVGRCARLLAAANGGQVVLSVITQRMAEGGLPDKASTRDLGVHHLLDLTDLERVYQLCHPDLPAEFPPLATRDSIRHNLPRVPTRFIGRAAELATLTAALDEHRLVTLLGPGGAGKTRLALEAAAQRVDTMADGVWFVPLSGLGQGAPVLPAIGAALGLRDEPGRPIEAAVTAHLATRSLLLVLDNCEHVIDNAAAATARALAAGDGVRVLATSRHPVRLEGEQTVSIAGLENAPDLFVDRALQLDPGFSLTQPDREMLADVCRRLDQLPLAVELAAALVDRMSIGEIAQRLTDRFELLITGKPTAEPRQRTLGGALDWSYDLLDADSRDALATLSVFPAGFDLLAAAAVLGHDAADVIGALVHHSLVAYGDGRYSMLDSIRAYAAERLAASGRAGQINDRALDWALDIARRNELDLLEREHENVLATMGWAVNRRPHDALALVNGLGVFWETRGYWSEGRRLIEIVVASTGNADPAGRAAALQVAGRLASSQGDLAAAEPLLVEGLALAEDLDDDRLVFDALMDLGGVTHMRGDVAEANVHFDAALGIARALDDPRSIASALANLGILAHATGQLDRAAELYGEALPILRNTDDALALARVLANAGMVVEARGDIAAATALYDEALELNRATGQLSGTASVQVRRAQVHQSTGDRGAARAAFQESLEMFRDLGDRTGYADVLYRLGELARTEGALDDARSMFEESLSVWREVGHAMGEAALLLSVGEIDRLVGDDVTAAVQFGAALEMMQSLGNLVGIALVVDHIAALAASRSELELATTLIGAAAGIRTRIGLPPPPQEEWPFDPDALRAALGEEAYEANVARGGGLDDAGALDLALTATRSA